MYRILVVPDDLLQTELGPSFLDRQTCKVRTAATVSETLAMAHAWLPDVILFSSHLGDEIGPDQFCDRVRNTAGLHRTKMVMLTDRYPDDGATELARVRCDSHLISPIDPMDLLETVAALLDVRMRDAPRIPVEIMSQLTGFGRTTGAAAVANMVSLSEVGMKIEASRELELGSAGTVRFVLPETTKKLHIPATVRFVADEIQLCYGFTFGDIGAHELGLIRTFIAQRLGEARVRS